jgi:uncharacterized protein (TIGR02099 family)
LTATPSPPSSLRRGLRQLRAWLLALLAVLIITTAVLVGLGRALIPYADSLRPWLTDRLSEELGEPVQIGQLEAQWPRLTPQLRLLDVRVGPAGNPLLEVDQARIEVRLANLIDGDRNLVELIVLGLSLILEEDEAGQWGVRVEDGARIGQRERDGDPRLLGDLIVRDARLTVRTQTGLELAARLAEGEVQRRGSETAVRGRMEPLGGSGNPLEFSFRLQAEAGRWISGQAWIGADALELGDWLSAPGLPAGATVSLDAWTDWSEARGGRIDMDLAVDGLAGNDDGLEAEVLISRQDRATQIELVELRRPGPDALTLIEGLAVARQGDAWALALDELALAPLHALLSPWFNDRVWWPSALSGQVASIEAGWRLPAGLTRLSGDLRDLSWQLPARFPSISQLDLTLGLSGDRPVLTPRGQPRVVWDSVFKEPIDLIATAGRAILSWRAIELQGLLIDTGFARGPTDGWLYFEQRKPFMDLMIEVEELGPLDPRRYMPQRFIPPKTLEWLNRALTRVESASGFVLLSMQAGLKTPQIRRGHVISEIAVEGADIVYNPDWPAGVDLSGEATFVGREIYASVDSGRLGDLPLAAADLAIPDLVDPVLSLTLASGPSEAADVQALLTRLPAEVWQRSLAPMAWRGPVDITTRLRLPIKRMPDWWMEGEATLSDTTLRLPDAGLRFDALSGTVGFDRRALGPATLTLTGGGENGSTGDRARGRVELIASFTEPGWLELTGELNPLDILDDPGPLRGRVTGSTSLSARVAAHDQGGIAVELNSDLLGLGLDLPAPLAKPAASSWPTRLDLRLDAPVSAASLVVEDVFELAYDRDAIAWRAGVSLDDRPVALPASGLRARGDLALLNLDEWRQLLADPMAEVGTAGADQIDADIELSVADLILAGVRLEDVAVVLGRDASAWRARFDGPDVAGEVVVPIPLDSGRVVVADLERLRFDPIAPDQDPPDLAALEMARKTSTENPVGRPPLHLLVEDLRWGALDLGRARLESHPSADGIEVELIDVSGPDLRLNGTGRWVWRDGRPESQFSGRLTTDSVGPLLESGGYQAPLQAARSQLEVDLRWPGAPADFALARLSGVLDLQIADGLIPEARPGAGRLLGLGSLAALPRRLALDFRDVFESGLKFDQIEGRFDLAAGFARTDALTVYSPAVRITISGDTDMANRQYDQVVRVEPGLGGTLPVIGVLAGGPVGAAAGLVLQSILERPMRGLAEARYTVTGPWSDPQMELVGARASDANSDEAGEADSAGPDNPLHDSPAGDQGPAP